MQKPLPGLHDHGSARYDPTSICVTTLQQALVSLVALEKWAEQWQHTISVDKCAVLQIGKEEEYFTLSWWLCPFQYVVIP